MTTETYAIILNSMNYGDTSKILTSFTRDAGPVKLLAKGIRSGKNRNIFNIGIGSVSSLIYYNSKSSDLHTLSKSEALFPTDKILTSIKHLNITMFIVESLLQSLPAGLPFPALFDSSATSLLLLNQLPKVPFALFMKHQFALAEAIGYEIAIPQECNPLFFDYASSTFIPNEHESARLGINFSESESAILHFIYGSAFEELATPESSIEITPQEKVKFLDFFTKYFSFHLEKQFHYTVY